MMRDLSMTLPPWSLMSPRCQLCAGTGMATDKTIGEVFCKACGDGDVEDVRHCIGLKVDVNCAKPGPGLIEASVNKRYRVVDLLLQQPGIDVNIRGGRAKFATAQYAACQENSIEVVRRLLSRSDIDVNAGALYGGTALHVAADYGHFDCVKLLLDCSALDVNKKTNYGSTAIVFAVGGNHRAVVELLM